MKINHIIYHIIYHIISYHIISYIISYNKISYHIIISYQHDALFVFTVLNNNASTCFEPVCGPSLGVASLCVENGNCFLVSGLLAGLFGNFLSIRFLKHVEVWLFYIVKTNRAFVGLFYKYILSKFILIFTPKKLSDNIPY
jgi:hypothetical protein